MSEIRRLFGLVFCCTALKARKERRLGSLGIGNGSETKGIPVGSGQGCAFQRLSEIELGRQGAAMGFGGSAVANKTSSGGVSVGQGKILVTTTTELRILSSDGKNSLEGSECSLPIPGVSANIGRTASAGHWGEAYGAAGHSVGPTYLPGRTVALGSNQWVRNGPKVPSK
jgi:hypothetical protein